MCPLPKPLFICQEFRIGSLILKEIYHISPFTVQKWLFEEGPPSIRSRISFILVSLAELPLSAIFLPLQITRNLPYPRYKVKMADKETCTICLDHLFHSNFSTITKLQPCAHYYHTECIDAWKERSNTCPTCRNDYDIIEMVDVNGLVKSSVVATKMVELPVNHDEFFAENADLEGQIEEEDRIQRRINMLIASSNSCVLCDSHNGNVTSCSTCASTFHHRCLGLGSASYWVCPMCDADQIVTERPSQFRRSRNSALTNRVYNSHRHLILPNTSAAVADHIFERETITPEEQSSWDALEVAKKEQQTNEDKMDVDTNEQSLTEPPKKLKQPSRRGRRTRIVKSEETDPAILQSSVPSLVNSILDQFKQNRTKETANVKIRTVSSTSGSPSSRLSTLSLPLSLSPSLSPDGSPVLSPSLSPSSPTDSETSKSNKSVWKMESVSSKDELSLEQKSILQEIVRSKLRPLYKNGEINFDQYTNINKKVSHILYDHFISNQGPNPDFEAIAHHQVLLEIMDL